MRSFMLIVFSLPVAIAAGVLLSGCGSRDAESGRSREAPLAQVNGTAITEADFEFEVRRRLESGRPLGEPQVILKEIIERQVMLQEAERSDIMQDPAVRRELENKQLGQWLDRSLQVLRDEVRVSDDEMRAYYDARQDEFTRPEMARLAMLYRRVNPRDPQESVESLRVELEKGASEFLADRGGVTQNGRLPGFGTVAARYSEDTVSRYRGGDLGWLGTSGADSRIPLPVIEAGLSLAVGSVSAIISAGDGLYMVMKTDVRPARVDAFEDVAPALRRRLIRLKQDDVERSFRSNLLTGAKIEINQDKAQLLKLPPVTTPEPPVLLPAAGFAPGGE